MASLFGATQPSGLFGAINPAQSQTAQGTSLFGNTQNQSHATNPGSNLFGAQPSNTTQTSSPAFPHLGQSTNQNPPQNLFGTSSNQNQQQQNNTGTTNLFAPAASQTQQATSLFGAPQSNANTVNGTSGSLMGQQAQENTQQGSAVPKSANVAAFDRLLEKGRKRARDLDGGPGFREVPSLQLGLSDIGRRVRELGNSFGLEKPSSSVDPKAQYLLAASGVNIGTTRRDLDSFAAETIGITSVKQLPDWDPDSHKYVQQLQQRQTERMVAEGLERAQKRFNEYLEETVDIDWDMHQRRIYEHFGLTQREPDEDNRTDGTRVKGSFGQSRKSKLGKSTTPAKSTLNRSVFGQSSLQKSVIGTPGRGSDNATVFVDAMEKDHHAGIGSNDRFLREKQRRYAERVQSLNQARLRKARARLGAGQQEAPYPICKEFLAVEDQPSGDAPKQILDAYKALVEITSEGIATERQYASDYLDETPRSTKTLRLRQRVLEGSKASLEKAFLGELEALVTRNPKEGNLGGVPTTINKVRAYVRIRAARKDLIPDGLELAMLNDDFCWALIYYLLRCGLVNEAAEYVVKNLAHFKTIDRNIITFITTFAKSPEKRLEGRLQRECNNVFSAMTKVAPGDSVDPYKIACYKIIGRCEMSKRTLDHVGHGVDDWIWLQFALAREVDRAEENAGDVYGLEEVQETINEIGQRHFAKGAEGLGGYGTYFYLQILGGLFEQAVAYLYPYSYTLAVHFAIALDYYGLLRVSDFSATENELLTKNTKDLPQISFGRMIGFYTRDFRASDVDSAVDYLALICLNADLPGDIGQRQAALCHEGLRELVLESREFANLLGDIRSDGVRIKGRIENRLELLHLADQTEFLETVTVQAASVADGNGRIADAVLLYHLSEDFDNVITVVNRSLSEHLSADLGSQTTRLQPLKPRVQDGAGQSSNTSLSLTSVDDPYVLAKNMLELYTHNAVYAQQVKPVNRETCQLLLRLCEAKAKVSAQKWAEAYEIIQDLNILPLTANGSTSAIRMSSQNFNGLPLPIARLIGSLLLWTITCISHERETLASRQYGAASGASKQLSDQYLSAARDIMVFAGLVKYRLSERVWEAICNVAGDTGAY